MPVLLSLIIPVAVLLLALTYFTARGARVLALIAAVLAVFAICFLLVAASM